MGGLVNWKSGTNGVKLFQTFGTLPILVYLRTNYMSSMNFEAGLSLKSHDMLFSNLEVHIYRL